MYNRHIISVNNLCNIHLYNLQMTFNEIYIYQQQTYLQFPHHGHFELIK